MEKINTRLYLDKCYRDEENLRRERENKARNIEKTYSASMEWMFWNLMKKLEELPDYKLMTEEYREMNLELRNIRKEKMEELEEWMTEESKKRKSEKHEKWRKACAAGLPYSEWNN